jgi:FKBP-type peptidyl-prolyl cis-trans isomerase
MKKGIDIEVDQPGDGDIADKGSVVTIKYSLFLNRGDCIQKDEEYTFELGKRRAIAGLEYAVEGMKVKGKRTVRVSPHLAYKSNGVLHKIPPNAVLIFEIELLKVAGTKE